MIVLKNQIIEIKEEKLMKHLNVLISRLNLAFYNIKNNYFNFL